MRRVATWFHTAVKSHTLHLTAIFLAVIMGMSLAFSVALYSAASAQLDKQMPKSGFVDIDGVFRPDQRVQQFLDAHIQSGKQEIIVKLVLMNVFTLVVGAIVSYFLARRALRPIELTMLAQEQFISDASHELKTPLTVVQTTNEVALRNKELKLRDAKDVIKSNIEDVTRLHRLTTMLLELANQEVTLDIRRTDIHEIISIALTNSVKNASLKQISIDDQTRPELVLADYTAAAQALSVVLDNAVKYSPEGDSIKLSTSVKRGVVYLAVTDHGDGIAEEDIEHIFDRFYRSDRARSKLQHEGYGLGLALARKLMRLQGGTITVSSELGRGSTFVLGFRLARNRSGRSR